VPNHQGNEKGVWVGGPQTRDPDDSLVLPLSPLLKGGRQEGGGHDSKRSGNVKEWGGAVRGGGSKDNEQRQRAKTTSKDNEEAERHSKTSAHVPPGKTPAHVPQSNWKRAVASVKKFKALSVLSSNKKALAPREHLQPLGEKIPQH